MKDWHLLEDHTGDKAALQINLPLNDKAVIIFFSFLGANGLPFAPQEYNDKFGRTICADLPELNLNKICIGTVDDKNNNENFNLIIKIPRDEI